MQEKERLFKDIINLRMELYRMFPDKITDISNLFQFYNLEWYRMRCPECGNIMVSHQYKGHYKCYTCGYTKDVGDIEWKTNGLNGEELC